MNIIRVPNGLLNFWILTISLLNELRLSPTLAIFVGTCKIQKCKVQKGENDDSILTLKPNPNPNSDLKLLTGVVCMTALSFFTFSHFITSQDFHIFRTFMCEIAGKTDCHVKVFAFRGRKTHSPHCITQYITMRRASRTDLHWKSMAAWSPASPGAGRAVVLAGPQAY